jgi:hypothetical protein
MRGIPLLAEDLLASQEGLYFTERESEREREKEATQKETYKTIPGVFYKFM